MPSMTSSYAVGWHEPPSQSCAEKMEHKIEDFNNRSRKGVLPTLCISAIVYVLIVYPEARAWLAWAFTEALIWGISLPALCASAYFLFNYLSTVCIRPNATRVHWSTVAFGHGIAASFFLLLAGPQMGRWLEGYQWHYTLPEVTLALPAHQWPDGQWPGLSLIHI